MAKGDMLAWVLEYLGGAPIRHAGVLGVVRLVFVAKVSVVLVTSVHQGTGAGIEPTTSVGMAHTRTVGAEDL